MSTVPPIIIGESSSAAAKINIDESSNAADEITNIDAVLPAFPKLIGESYSATGEINSDAPLPQPSSATPFFSSHEEIEFVGSWRPAEGQNGNVVVRAHVNPKKLISEYYLHHTYFRKTEAIHAPISDRFLQHKVAFTDESGGADPIWLSGAVIYEAAEGDFEMLKQEETRETVSATAPVIHMTGSTRLRFAT